MIPHKAVPHVEHVLDLVLEHIPRHPQMLLVLLAKQHRLLQQVQVLEPQRRPTTLRVPNSYPSSLLVPLPSQLPPPIRSCPIPNMLGVLICYKIARYASIPDAPGCKGESYGHALEDTSGSTPEVEDHLDVSFAPCGTGCADSLPVVPQPEVRAYECL